MKSVFGMLAWFGTALTLLAPQTGRQASEPARKSSNRDLENHVLIHLVRGSEFVAKQLYREGEAEYRSAIELDPVNVEVRLALGDLLDKEGKLDAAIEQYREAINLDLRTAEGHRKLGYALYEKGDID